MNDRRIRMRERVGHGLLGAATHAGEERVPSVGVLLIEEREVRREALAQPDVVPVAFGRGIAEPLMGHLVRDELPSGHAAVAVEDVGGQLHAARDGRRLDLRELLVRVRTDVIADRTRRIGCVASPKPLKLSSRSCGIHPGRERHAADRRRNARRQTAPRRSKSARSRIGVSSRQLVRRRPSARSVSSTGRPFEMTWYFCGAVTVIDTAAFIDGWSIVATQLRARSGQSLLKKPRSP